MYLEDHQDFCAMVIYPKAAELQRRLGSGSDDSGMPPSKEPIEVKARGKPSTHPTAEVAGQAANWPA